MVCFLILIEWNAHFVFCQWLGIKRVYFISIDIFCLISLFLVYYSYQDLSKLCIVGVTPNDFMIQLEFCLFVCSQFSSVDSQLFFLHFHIQTCHIKLLMSALFARDHFLAPSDRISHESFYPKIQLLLNHSSYIKLSHFIRQHLPKNTL